MVRARVGVVYCKPMTLLELHLIPNPMVGVP